MKRNFVTPLLIAGLVLSLMAGCSGDQEQAGSSGSTSGAAGQETSTGGLAVGHRQGDLAPDFSLQNINGGQITLSQFKGKAVLIDFWDTWCPPCRRAMPHLQELSETYADDLVVVGVAMGREGEEKVRSYVQENGLTFEFALADAPQYSVLKAYGGIQSIPTSFLVDRDGVIREVWTGGMPKAAYEKAVRAVLGV